MRARLTALALGCLASNAGSVLAACATLDLHVAGGTGRPPLFSTLPAVSFPHVRLAATPSEAWRAGDVTGADSGEVRLYALKGPGADQATLLVEAGCAAIATFADTAVYLRDVHVATTGTPAGDGSAASPYDTIARAAQSARPGDRIVVHAGTYPGSAFLSGLAGTERNPIRIGGADGEPPPVLGSSAVGEALHLTDPAWVVLEDLVVDGPTGNGINIDDGGDYSTPAHHVVVRRVAVRNIGQGGNQDCIKLSGLDDFHVLDCDIRACGAGGSGVDMVGCHRGRIAASTFRGSGANAVQAKGGSSEVTIHGNLMVDAGPRAMNLGGSTGLAFFRPPGANYEARALVATANVVVRSDAPVAYVGCDGCLVANNTFWLPQRWALRILQETTEPGFVECRDGRFVNNLVVFDGASISTFVNIGPDTRSDTFLFASNLWFSRDDPGFPGPSLPTPEQDPVIQRDPRLLDPAGEDFHLGAGSPAIGAGRCLPEVGLDRDGVCYFDPPAIGAHERE